MLDVDKAVAALGRSNRKLGAEVLELWRKLEHDRDEFPQPEAIGVKLGLLRNGDPTWWSNHRRALEALARILACKPEEIVAADQKVSAIISAFPELSPVLPGQEPCQLRDDGSWLGALVSSLLSQEPRSWLVAPHGSGKSLTLDVLRQRLGDRVATRRCRCLLDAVELATTAVPLVVEISELDLPTDGGALAELSKASVNVCVLAPFSCALVHHHHLRARWREVRWAPNADWRERLVRWANARAPKPADLEVERVLELLRDLDPDERLFTTPEDVLIVASREYRAGLPGARDPLRELACEHLGRVFARSDDQPWVRDLGLDAVVALIEARLSSSEHLLRPLSLEAWSRLLPEKLAPQPGSAGKTKARSVEAPPTRTALRLLIEHGVLRTQEDGEFDFAPWVRAGVERHAMASLIRGDDLDWALLAIEPSRRTVVDGALDATPPPALLRLLRRVPGEDPAELRTVAAIEALFSALSRRLASGWTVPKEALGDVQRLGLRQLELIRGLPENLGFPGNAALTRQVLDRGPDAMASWLGEAWTFSFEVEVPKLDQDPGWILPGWSRNLRLEDARGIHPRLQADPLLQKASRRAVGACNDQVLPAEVADCLLPWVIIDGPGRGWELTTEVQRGLFRSSGAADLVGRLLQAEPPETRAQGARTAWSAALAEQPHPYYALKRIADISRALHQVVLENLPGEDFAAAFRAPLRITMEEVHVLRDLPLRLLRPALVALVERVERDNQPAHELAPVLAALEEEDLDLLVRFGARGHTQGYAAAERVWSVSPESARERLCAALAADDPEVRRMAQVWFDTAPTDRLDDLLGLLEGLGADAPSWCASWLAIVLPHAGRSAPAAYRLLRKLAPHR